MDAPPGHNPNVSVFQGGDTVQITPMQGGADIAEVLGVSSPQEMAAKSTEEIVNQSVTDKVSSQPTDQLKSIPFSQQAPIAAAAAVAALGAAAAGASIASQTEAGVSAAIKENILQSSKNSMKNINISDDDSKILLTARKGPEQDGAIIAGITAYDASIKAGESPPQASHAKAKAAIIFIKNYRKSNPYDDPTISMSVSSSEAQSILNTTDIKEKDIGKKAYESMYKVSIEKGYSKEDAKDAAIIAQVNAIKNYREKPEAIKASKTMTEDEVSSLVNTLDSVEKELGELASRKAIEEAKEKGIPMDQWKEIGIIAAAERIELHRGDKKIIETIKKRPPKRSSLNSIIDTTAKLPLYIEYTNVTKNLKSPYIEIYEKRTADAKISNTFQLNMKNHIASYQAKQMQLWARASQTATLPQTQEKKAFSPGEIITSFSRLNYILPISTEDIIVLPPMNGNVNNFMKALQTLDEMGIITSDFVIRKNTVVVCTAPFYLSKVDAEQIIRNNILLLIALDIIAKSPNQWFVLAEHTSDGYLVGSTIAGRSPNDLIVNMIEPSYVTYPYKRRGIEGIIISSSTNISLPADASKKVSLDSIYTNRSFGKELVQAYKPDLKTEAAPGFFTVAGSLNPMTVPNERVGSCGLANYSLPESIPTLHPSKKINLSTDVKGVGVILSFRLKVNSAYTPFCATETIVKEVGTKFIGSPEAYINPSHVQFALFEVAGQMLKIRRTNKIDKVYNNWRDGIYTDDEAKLLNILHLKPSIMDKIFPLVFKNGDPVSVPWKDWVANFLSTVTIKNKSLTTHRETMIVRNFLERVRAYFISIGLKHDLDESDSDDDVHVQRGLIEPDGLEDLVKEDFRDIKHEWGKLDIYENRATSQWICSIVLVNKNTYKQMYKTVGVDTKQYNRNTAKNALETKINTLKAKYPDWMFIY